MYNAHSNTGGRNSVPDQVVEMAFGEYGSVSLAVPEEQGIFEEVGLQERLSSLKVNFEKVASAIQTCCRGFVDVGKNIAREHAPKEMDLEFGITVKAGAAIIAHLSQEAHFTVRFKWEFRKEAAVPVTTTSQVPLSK
jgi:hypothetical protein